VTFDIATAEQHGNCSQQRLCRPQSDGPDNSRGAIKLHFDVTVNGDVNIEPNETFFVNVTNVAGATITDGQGLGTIQNDDSSDYFQLMNGDGERRKQRHHYIHVYSHFYSSCNGRRHHFRHCYAGQHRDTLPTTTI